MSKSLREQLVGAWELIEYCAYLPNDESDKVYPQGQDAQGIIMYTADGYMSAQILTLDQESSLSSSNEEDRSQIKRDYLAYTGQFYLDEAGDSKGPVLIHHMKVANRANMLGDTQRRLCKIVDEHNGQYLVLSLNGTTKAFGEDRIVRVRWRRLPENRATQPPR
ncbi:hypothetical protein LTR05_003298 [Lithohypha guttulata]|uniref:Lipocalin-like domain-containing protein n=1 Tax=Lithohypha guttulata TaxID=1690604 RepID=A0AAN7T6E6_9EURO|nr:hypothetical protein LTR05_003298 [Lithohypha guttulata]